MSLSPTILNTLKNEISTSPFRQNAPHSKFYQFSLENPDKIWRGSFSTSESDFGPYQYIYNMETGDVKENPNYNPTLFANQKETMEKTAGLYSQIQQLKKRLKALDAAEANPSDITEVSKALEALEARYDKQKESKRVRMEERKKKEADEFNSQVLQLMGGDEAKPESAPASTEKVARGCDQCEAAMINGVFCHETGCPNSRKQTENDDMDMDASTTSQAATTVLALDTRVEPTRGTPGSHGRVMRHDAGSDTVYVMWDGGKLKEAHGFGAYSLADLKVHSAEEKKVPPHNAGPEHYCPECTPKKTAEPMPEPTPEDVQNMPNAQNPVAPQGPKGNPEKRYQQIKKIVDESQHGKVEGQMVDGFTASLLLQISDQLNPENRLKFLSLPMGRMVDVAWKLANKSAASETEAVVKEAGLKCPKCGSTNVTPAFGHKLNKCDSCHLAFDDESSEKEAAEFGSHGNGKGLNDLYVLPSTPEEGQKIEQYLKSIDRMFEWSNANVKGHAWYGKRFIEIPFGESLQPEIEKMVGGPVVATLKHADYDVKCVCDGKKPDCKHCKGTGKVTFSGSLKQADAPGEEGLMGWPNKETWATKLWMDNDSDWFHKSREIAQRAKSPEELAKLLQAEMGPLVAKEIGTRTQEAMSPEKIDWITVADVMWDEIESAKGHEAPAPEEKDLLDDAPVMDKSKIRETIDKLLEQLHAETDPAKKEQIKQRIKSLKSAARHPQLKKIATEGEGPSGVGYGGDRPGINVAPMRDEDVSLEATKLNVGDRVQVSEGSGIDSGVTGTITSRWEFGANVGYNERGVPNIPGHYKPVDWSREVPIKRDDGSYMTMFINRVQRVAHKMSKVTIFAKELTVHTHQDKVAYDIFDGEQKILTITPKEALSPEQIEVIVAQEYAKKNVVKAHVVKDLTVLKKGHQVRILALDEKKLHVKFASLESPELTGWAPFTKFQIIADEHEDEIAIERKMDRLDKKLMKHELTQEEYDKEVKNLGKKAHANPGECLTCRRSRDMHDQGNGTSKCSYCGTVSKNKDLDGGGGRPADKVADLQEMKHGDHVDRILGQRDNEVLAFCGNKVVWLPKGDMTSTTPPPATPESLNDMDAEKVEMPKEEFVKEHKNLLKVLKSPSHADDLKEYDKQKKELEEHASAEHPGGPCKGCGKDLPVVWGATFCKECVDKGLDKEASPLCANCGVRFKTMEEYAKHKEEAHKASDPTKTQQIKDRVEKKLAPHLVSKRLGKKDPKYNYDEEMENAEELPEDAEASKTLPAVEKSADDVNTPPTQQAPQGMKWSWDADKRRWFLVKQQGMI